MKAPDLLTVALIGLAVYLVLTSWRERSRTPRAYYAEPGTSDWWA
jgi:hypothetical protein